MTDIGCSGTSATASSASYGRIGINALAGISNAGNTARMQVGISSFMRADGICLTDSRGCTIVKRNSSEFIGAQKSDQLSNLPSQYTWLEGDGNFMSTVSTTLCVHKWRNTNGAVSLNGYSNRVQSFAFISDGLTDLESLKLSRIIEKYQTDLGRNVTPNEFGYDAGRSYVKIWNDQSGNGLDLKMMTQHAQPIIAKNGLLLKENNRPTMEFNGLYSGMIGGLLTNTSTFHVTSYHVVGSVLGPGTYAGNNISGSNYILSIIPAASFTANSQASNYYLPPKTGLGSTPNLANHNTEPTVGFTYLKQIWTIAPTNVAVGVTQSIINFHNGGGYYAITKDNIEGTTTMGAGTPASGYMSIGWLQTANPYNYYTNMRLAEMIFQKSSMASGYFSSLDGSIYTKSQILKNQSDYFNIISIPTVDDSDAQKFVTQTRIGTSEANAINTLVKGLKSAGLWNKLVKILPFVGSDSWSQRFNLKDPLWTNRGTLGTATSHTSQGFVSNGASTGVINTWINLNTTFTYNNIHMSAYVDNIVSNGLSMGASSTSHTALAIGTTSKLFRLSGFSGGLSVTNSSTAGYYIGNSLGTSMKMFENGVSIGSMTPTSTSLNATGHAYVGGAGDSNQSARFKFATFGYGLTDAEASSLSTLVNTFLVAIGRI
jgi:hypothetical protein